MMVPAAETCGTSAASHPDKTPARGRLRGRAIAVPLLLAALAVASRIPFRSHFLHHWDSVNFALALEQFDVHRHQPHPPGMFVIYVFLGKLLLPLVADANAALVWLSIGATAVTVALAYALGRSWFGWRAGWAAALLTLTSPLVWFQGEVALSYLLESAWVLLLALACRRASCGNAAALIGSALLLGLSGGIRPDIPAFLFPLWCAATIVSLRRQEHPLRCCAAVGGVLVLGVALWAVPLIALSGGVGAYWDVLSTWSYPHTEQTRTLADTAANVTRLALATLYGLGCAVVPFGVVALRERQTLRQRLRYDWRAWTMALWVLPGAAFLTFVHMKQTGHVFGILPAVLVIAAVAAVQLVRRPPHGWVIVVGAVAAGNCLGFLYGPPAFFGSVRMILSAPTWAAVRSYDAYVGERLAAIRQHFSPREAAVLANSRNFRIPDYYLRDFLNVSISRQTPAQPMTLPDDIHTLVLFDEPLEISVSGRVERHALPLASGATLRAISWSAHQRASIGGNLVEVDDK